MTRQAMCFLFVALLTAAVPSQAGDRACTPNREGKLVCPQADAACRKDRYGDVVSSSPGGGIEINRYGDVVCAPGYCTTDLRGDIWCSNQPRGAASMNRYGQAECAGACVAAGMAACVRPKPAP